MKEIKAFIHRNRIADVIHALKTANFNNGANNLSISEVAGSLAALDNKERDYSIEFGEDIITTAKLEMICEDERVDEAMGLIKEYGRTGQPLAGWIYVLEISTVLAIEG